MKSTHITVSEADGHNGTEEPAKTGNSNNILGSDTVTMERQSKGALAVLFYMAIYVNVDLWKQVTSYGMKYYNGGVYPVPQTFLVTVTELMKLAIFIVIAAREGSLGQIRLSPWYALPSLIYAVNNNIYFFALHYTTPPVWNIVIQIRLLVTALAYRIFFKKVISPIQWFALGLIIVAIVLTQLLAGDIDGVSGSDLTIPLLLATVGSFTSTSASFIMEFLFKNDKRNFSEMQIQIYLFGSLGSLFLYGLETYSTHSETPVGGDHWVWFLLVASIIMCTLTGVTVAFIVKRLDNIVKLYTQALATMMTSVACAIFFPDDFHISVSFIGCLSLMMLAIFLYEGKGISVTGLVEKCFRGFSRMGLEKLAIFVLATMAAAICMFTVI